jgi:hypothetical protein
MAFARSFTRGSFVPWSEWNWVLYSYDRPNNKRLQAHQGTGPFKRLLSDLMHHATESPLCAGCSDEKVSVDHARHLHRGRSHRDVDIVVTELGELDYGQGFAPVAAEGVMQNAASELLGE